SLHLQPHAVAPAPLAQQFSKPLLRKLRQRPPEVEADVLGVGCWVLGVGLLCIKEQGQIWNQVVPAALAKLGGEVVGPVGIVDLQAVAEDRSDAARRSFEHGLDYRIEVTLGSVP